MGLEASELRLGAWQRPGYAATMVATTVILVGDVMFSPVTCHTIPLHYPSQYDHRHCTSCWHSSFITVTVVIAIAVLIDMTMTPSIITLS